MNAKPKAPKNMGGKLPAGIGKPKTDHGKTALGKNKGATSEPVKVRDPLKPLKPFNKGGMVGKKYC